MILWAFCESRHREKVSLIIMENLTSKYSTPVEFGLFSASIRVKGFKDFVYYSKFGRFNFEKPSREQRAEVSLQQQSRRQMTLLQWLPKTRMWLVKTDNGKYCVLTQFRLAQLTRSRYFMLEYVQNYAYFLQFFNKKSSISKEKILGTKSGLWSYRFDSSLIRWRACWLGTAGSRRPISLSTCTWFISSQNMSCMPDHFKPKSFTDCQCIEIYLWSFLNRTEICTHATSKFVCRILEHHHWTK